MPRCPPPKFGAFSSESYEDDPKDTRGVAEVLSLVLMRDVTIMVFVLKIRGHHVAFSYLP